MRTLSEHNASYDKLFEAQKREMQRQEMELRFRVDPAGVICPRCKFGGHEVEMVYDKQGDWTPRLCWDNHWNNPVRCPRCGYKNHKKDIHSWGT